MGRDQTIDLRETSEAPDDGRGGTADSPLAIPPKGWKDIAIRTKEEVKKDSVSVLSAGVAFYFMVSLFPFAIAALSIYGLVAQPGDVTALVDQFRGAVPDSVATLIETQLTSIAESSDDSLTFGLIASVLVAVWSASKGASALIKATNIAFDEEDKRGFLRLRLLALAFTVAFLAVLIVAVGVIAIIPPLLSGLPGPADTVFAILRWPLLAVVAMVGLSALYRFAPHRDDPQWRWVSLGAVTATVLWLGGSALFSLYANNFGSFDETYGSLSAVVILLLWLNLTAFAILLGAEINAETERQTGRDSTRGEPKPMGERNAFAADTLGERVGAER